MVSGWKDGRGGERRKILWGLLLTNQFEIFIAKKGLYSRGGERSNMLFSLRPIYITLDEGETKAEASKIG